MKKGFITAVAIAALSFPVMGNALTVNIAEQARVDNGEVSVPTPRTVISENANGGINGGDPGTGPSDFTVALGSDTDFTFYGTMEGGSDAFRFAFTSSFTASLDTFAFQTGASGSVIDFDMNKDGSAPGSSIDMTFDTDGATEVFGTFGPGVYDFFIDGGPGSGDPVDYDLSFAAVPLPAAGWAMIAALGALVGLRRRRQSV